MDHALRHYALWQSGAHGSVAREAVVEILEYLKEGGA
jgi:hypothetical protein